MVTTTDNKWELPLFHITGSIADGPYPQSTGGESEILPSLFQHGAYSDAIDWLGYFNQEPFMLQLADRGHDIWFGNNRGTKYAVNKEGYTIYEREYWDFDMSDMAKYDIPAFID